MCACGCNGMLFRATLVRSSYSFERIILIQDGGLAALRKFPLDILTFIILFNNLIRMCLPAKLTHTLAYLYLNRTFAMIYSAFSDCHDGVCEIQSVCLDKHVCPACCLIMTVT